MATQTSESHKVPYRVRLAFEPYSTERYRVLRDWCESPDVPGLFKIRSKTKAGDAKGQRVPVRVFMFSDPDMAFAFRMQYS